MGGSPLDILLDSGASKCYMSKTFFDKNVSLHKLPQYRTNIQGLRVGSGELVPAHFLVPVVFKVVRHKFEILALVSDIKGSTDLVFGIKNMFEVEGELSCRNSEFRFLNRAVPIFCSENLGAHYEFANFNKLASVYEDMRLAKYQMKQKEEAKKLQKKTLKRKAEEPEKIAVETEDQYPWLPADDKRRKMSDDKIIEKFVDLTDSDMTEEEKFEFIQVLKDYRDAFSLRDEIGECPNIRIDIDVIDDSPFFVRPFLISEEDKPIMDWQMKRMVSLGIIKQGTTSHTSPVFLISRKQTQDKRPLVDFRPLNTRVKRQNTATPLLRDIYQMLGASESNILSCVDLKDAFHSLRLTEKAKDFCGILPYFGSPHYKYEVMPMGLSISPCKWIEYIGYVMENMSHKHNYITIMDDLLVHSKKVNHLDRIIDLLRALIKHGLKLSPKKCQFFRTELVYMGNVFKVQKGKFVISPIKTRVEATTYKACTNTRFEG